MINKHSTENNWKFMDIFFLFLLGNLYRRFGRLPIINVPSRTKSEFNIICIFLIQNFHFTALNGIGELKRFSKDVKRCIY